MIIRCLVWGVRGRGAAFQHLGRRSGPLVIPDMYSLVKERCNQSCSWSQDLPPPTPLRREGAFPEFDRFEKQQTNPPLPNARPAGDPEQPDEEAEQKQATAPPKMDDIIDPEPPEEADLVEFFPYRLTEKELEEREERQRDAEEDKPKEI